MLLVVKNMLLDIRKVLLGVRKVLIGVKKVLLVVKSISLTIILPHRFSPKKNLKFFSAIWFFPNKFLTLVLKSISLPIVDRFLSDHVLNHVFFFTTFRPVFICFSCWQAIPDCHQAAPFFFYFERQAMLYEQVYYN